MDPSYIRILIIDDQPIVRNGIKTMLEKGDSTDINFSITEAKTSSEAKYMLRADDYDLVVIDYELSDTDGATLCRQILSDYPQLRVLTLSSANSAENAQEMLYALSYQLFDNTHPVLTKDLHQLLLALHEDHEQILSSLRNHLR